MYKKNGKAQMEMVCTCREWFTGAKCEETEAKGSQQRGLAVIKEAKVLTAL
jgi:hypothetical protein